MNWWEHVLYALTMTLTHKMRAFLTTLGIIIGIISVTVMVSLGNSFSAQLQANFKERINLLTVYPKSLEIDGVARNGKVTNNDVNAISSSKASLEKISPELEVNQEVVYNAVKNSAAIIGIVPDYHAVNKEFISEGRGINKSDIKTENKSAVISGDLAKDFFKGSNPIGQDIQIGKNFFTIVGVLKKKSGLFGFGQNYKILIPLSTAQNHFSADPEDLSRIVLKVVDYKNIRSDKREIIYSLLKVRGISDAHNADFELNSDLDYQKEAEKSFQMMSYFLGGIGAISLLVGGIGVMNIMLVSVTERTREIGIRKALGAKRKDILWQFLIESIVVSLIGGGFGIALSYAIMAVVDSMAKNSIVGSDGTVFFISLEAVILAVSSSLVVGVFFGIFPAYKASRLKPIDALRFE